MLAEDDSSIVHSDITHSEDSGIRVIGDIPAEMKMSLPSTSSYQLLVYSHADCDLCAGKMKSSTDLQAETWLASSILECRKGGCLMIEEGGD